MFFIRVCFIPCYSDSGALLHLIKSSLGSGILAMPNAFKNGGLIFGLAGTAAIGVLCTHCIYLLVRIIIIYYIIFILNNIFIIYFVFHLFYINFKFLSSYFITHLHPVVNYYIISHT